MANLDYIGRDWSLWPPHAVTHPGSTSPFLPNPRSAQPKPEFNFVSGVWAVAARLLTILLLRRGEHPILFWLGMAPDLFKNLSSVAPTYFVSKARDAIEEANRLSNRSIGYNTLLVTVNPQTEFTDTIRIDIRFTVQGLGVGDNTLTFGFAEYLNALYALDLTAFQEGRRLTDNVRRFREGITLNGEPFYGFGRDV